jgi:TIR domain
MVSGAAKNGAAHGVSTAPRNWQGTNKFRLFISHIAKHKDRATRLRACLALYAISGFVAHEDIHPTLEWEQEIERALYTMDAFLAIHTLGFKDSFWTQQEIGFAVGRSVKIISFKMGEDPTGFISKHQALPRRGRTAEEIAREVDAILAADPLTAGKLDAAKRSNGLIQDDIRKQREIARNGRVDLTTLPPIGPPPRRQDK